MIILWTNGNIRFTLSLTCEDKSDQEVDFLDLHLVIRNRVLSYSLFDKRGHFNFPIVNFPNLSPTTQSYGVFMAQLIRYARGCQFVEDLKRGFKFLLKSFYLNISN